MMFNRERTRGVDGRQQSIKVVYMTPIAGMTLRTERHGNARWSSCWGAVVGVKCIRCGETDSPPRLTCVNGTRVLSRTARSTTTYAARSHRSSAQTGAPAAPLEIGYAEYANERYRPDNPQRSGYPRR